MKFDHTKKLYMHNPEYILENEMKNFVRDFGIQTDQLILARQTYLVVVTKKINQPNNELCCPGKPSSKIKRINI